ARIPPAPRRALRTATRRAGLPATGKDLRSPRDRPASPGRRAPEELVEAMNPRPASARSSPRSFRVRHADRVHGGPAGCARAPGRRQLLVVPPPRGTAARGLLDRPAQRAPVGRRLAVLAKQAAARQPGGRGLPLLIAPATDRLEGLTRQVDASPEHYRLAAVDV